MLLYCKVYLHLLACSELLGCESGALPCYGASVISVNIDGSFASNLVLLLFWFLLLSTD
uniref:Uncharacterized protein n=1 Tax=Arundo donax TaxID=35708 RepID=A0A0A9CLB2_ARUDO